MNGRILHVLAQRPHLTGSGVTLDALTQRAARAGWEQAVVVGTPIEDPRPRLEGVAEENVFPLIFKRDPLDFPLPGMSDVMPYESSRYSQLDPDQLSRYRSSWRHHLEAALRRFQPDLVHVHHLWLVGSLVREVSRELPTVAHSHATGIRQMELCPHLAAEAKSGNRRHDRILVLTADHRQRVARALDPAPGNLIEVGAGFSQEIFHSVGESPRHPKRLLFAGKLSSAKGLPFLLEAFSDLAGEYPDLELEVAGGGSGDESDSLIARMEGLGPRVRYLGRLDQRGLAERMQRASVFVLPSFYEGLPLVLVEALACGCRLVATELPGVVDGLMPHLGEHLQIIPLPRIIEVDQLHPEDHDLFVSSLRAALEKTLARPPLAESEEIDRALRPFTWDAVFESVESVWKELIRSR